jgi:Ca2+-binding EF-hand superfamily protein
MKISTDFQPLPKVMNPHAISLAAALFLSLSGSGAHASDYSELFARLDADSDGQLAKTEIPTDQAPLFRRLVRTADEDGDGKLSVEEFQTGLTSRRPEKPLTEKADNELPGADALLLLLAWMDKNADLSIDGSEVPSDLRPLFNEIAALMNRPESGQVAVPQLRQQAGRYAVMAQRFSRRQKIDVELELSLLNDLQWAYVERLRSSLRPGSMLANSKNASVVFSQLDTNGDGKVTFGEVPPPFADRFAVLMERADRNQDKQLSEQEIKFLSKRIASLETNRPPLAKTNQLVKQLLRRADRDNDGRLSREETPPRLGKRFAEIDENSNGFLDKNELTRAAEILAALRNSAEIQPASSPSADESIIKSAKN